MFNWSKYYKEIQHLDYLEPDCITKLEYKGAVIYLINYLSGVGITDYYSRYTYVHIVFSNKKTIGYNVSNDENLDLKTIIDMIDMEQ
jgi:hypothetical protein